MKLSDKLDNVLKQNHLQPHIKLECELLSNNGRGEESLQIEPKHISKLEDPHDDTVIYNNLDEAVANVGDLHCDDFGIISVMVNNIEENISLPMKLGNYVIDDAQKTKYGHYEVHIVSGQK